MLLLFIKYCLLHVSNEFKYYIIFCRVGLSVIQRNIRKWLVLRNWQWWKLYTKVKPLLNIARAEEEMKKKIEEMDKLREDLIKCERLKKELEVQNVTLLEQKNDLYLQLQTEQDAVADLEERVEKLVTQKADFEGQIKEMEERLLDEEDAAAELEVIKRKMEGENDELKKDIEDLENSLAKVMMNFSSRFDKYLIKSL
jgi:chromosome segregation ATPase